MTLRFHWFLPTNGDSRDVVGGGHGSPATVSGRDRPPTVAYLSQIARAAEDLGFVGALTPTGAWCEDAWLTTAMVSQNTERLKFLVAFRPGFVSPTLAAQMASTFQRQSGGRLLLNVVTGGESQEQRAYGDFLDKDDRYRRTGEFLQVVRGLWEGQTVDLVGEHLQVEGARLARVPDPVPEVYFGVPRPSPGRSPPGMPTSISPGASRRPPSPRRSPGSGGWPRRRAAASASASGCTSSPGTRASRRGRRPGGCWTASTPRPCVPCRPDSPGASPRGSGACSRCTAAAPTDWRSTRTSGRASGWCGAARARHWSAATTRSPSGSRSTTGSASTSSCCPATRTWRRRTGSARGPAETPYAGPVAAPLRRTGDPLGPGALRRCRNRAMTHAGRGRTLSRTRQTGVRISQSGQVSLAFLSNY